MPGRVGGAEQCRSRSFAARSRRPTTDLACIGVVDDRRRAAGGCIGAGRHADQFASESATAQDDDAPHGHHLRAADTPPDAAAAGVPNNVVPMRSKANKATGLLAAAAVVAALAMGAWAMESRNDAQESASQTQQLTQILGAPDVQTVTGKFTDGGHGTLVVSDSTDEALLVGSDLPELPDGKVYQAWTITDKAASAGTFSPDGDQTVISLPDAALTAKVVAVTVEERGGAKQPTSDPIFMVNVPT